MKTVGALIIIAALSTACGPADPLVSYDGTVMLDAAVVLDAGTYNFTVSFGDEPINFNELTGLSVYAHNRDATSFEVSHDQFPLEYAMSQLGLGDYDGQGIAVVDINGDDTISDGDLVGVIEFDRADWADFNGRLTANFVLVRYP